MNFKVGPILQERDVTVAFQFRRQSPLGFSSFQILYGSSEAINRGSECILESASIAFERRHISCEVASVQSS